MRKILIALTAGLFVLSLAACGSSSNKAKTASSDTDSSDTDSSDAKSSTRSSSSKSSSSASSSSRSSSSSSGGSADAYCSTIKGIASVFSDLDSGVPTDEEIDTLIAALRDLQDAAPSEIQDDMKTFIDIEVAAATAAKGAADNSDAQESAANEVIGQASDEFLAAVTKVDQFTTDTCGFDISGETTGSFSS